MSMPTCACGALSVFLLGGLGMGDGSWRSVYSISGGFTVEVAGFRCVLSLSSRAWPDAFPQKIFIKSLSVVLLINVVFRYCVLCRG